MKFKSLLLLALAALLTLAAPRPARALEVSFDFFHDSLSPYGEWIEVGDYGYCWRPTGVDEDWAPYADGYWSYTDAGWTWVSYEEFGGIVYHYGRWTNIEDEGWCWVPDYEWGPAWVSWRRDDDYVGWAPLPAEARWERERGISVWVDTTYDIGPSSYNFCRYHDFGAPVLRAVLVPRRENIVIINRTVNITNISYNNDARCVFNGGLDYGYINRFSRRQVPALKLVRNNNVTVVNNHIVNNNVRVTNFNAVQRGNQLSIIAPTVVGPPRERMDALLKPKITKVIPQQKVTRGWGGLPAEERAAIRAKFQQETAGKTPETMRAKPVKTADLKVIPVKADPKAKLPVINRNVPETVPTPNLGGDRKASEVTGRGPGRKPPIGSPIPGADDDKKAPEATAKVPVATPPAGVTMPPADGDAARTTRENVPGRKPGKLATPPPVIRREITDNPPPKIVTPTPAPIVRERPQPAQPGVVKPFNPPTDDNSPKQNVRKAATPPAINPAIEQRNAAAAAAKAQAALRQRSLEATEKQQEAARRNNAQEAAANRQQQMQQEQMQHAQKLQKNQQNTQAEAVARKRAADAQQMQQTQQLQQQQALRDRAAKTAETRQRSLEAQQSQAAAARAQSQAAARQQMQLQQQRNVPPPVQRNVPPPAQRNSPPVIQRNVPPPAQRNVAPPQNIPAKPGKRQLTPEEEAARQQRLR